MKALKNNYLWSIIGMFSLLSCDNNTHNIKVEEGYLKSTTYQEYLGGYKEDKSNTDYSTRRMFLLLGEEAFLYSSDYNFYAIYCYVSKENNDFYIMKSKDNIVCLSHKKLHTTDGFFYTNRSEDLDSDGRAFRMDVTTRLIENNTVWLGLKIHQAVDSINDLCFCFDWKNLEYKMAHRILPLLPVCKWYINEQEIKTTPGLKYVSPGERFQNIFDDEGLYLHLS
ncbi:MAG: hypothetical protein EOO20_21425, partial [Chryseobacterium sp.]